MSSYSVYEIMGLTAHMSYVLCLQRTPPGSFLLVNCCREPTQTAVSSASPHLHYTTLSFTAAEQMIQILLQTHPHICVGFAAPDLDEPTLIGGDIAIKSEADRNADPCTSRGCLWQKWSDGNVYIPYYITNHFCKPQLVVCVCI